MKVKLPTFVLGASLFTGVQSPTWAHHSFAAEFDDTKPLVLRGIVTKWELVNPHSWIHLDVKSETGAVISWMIEGGSPNALLRLGFTKNALPPGTEVVVHGFQAKSGTNKAVGVDLTYADGRRLFLGGSAPGANGGEPEKR